MKHLLTLLLFISISAIAADMDSIVNNEVKQIKKMPLDSKSVVTFQIKGQLCQLFIF